MNSYLTTTENTWCPGCGNFGIINCFQKAIALRSEHDYPLKNLIVVTGIGCHGKIFDYLNISGIYSLHGRALSTAQGIKNVNPDLDVVCFCGDGDAMGEGLEHTLFAAKRNADITLFIHNNGIYGLTTGQVSPLSLQGIKGPSTPFGNLEKPFSILPLLMEAGATFVARSYSAKMEHLTQTMLAAITHKGFSIVEILQPCVSFNNTYQLYNQNTSFYEEDTTSKEKALSAIVSTDKIALGTFFQVNSPVFHEQMNGAFNPIRNCLSRNKRIELIQKALN